MALVGRSLAYRKVVSSCCRYSLSAVNMVDVKKNDENDQALHKSKSNLMDEESRGMSRKATTFPKKDRATRMPVDQDWPSVWPAAASFRANIVPLPVRQGYVSDGNAPPGKEANLELMKIPNFLHLSPPAIERHCQELKKFCTKWPEALTDERSANWITITTSDYVHSGPSIRDERARIVAVKLKLSSLDLDSHAKDKFLRLVGERYNPKTDELVIVTDRCPMRHQNLDYSLYVLTALFHESWITEPWEITDIEVDDLKSFEYEKSSSKKFLEDYVSRVGNVPEDSRSQYADSLSRLKNEGDDHYNLNAYKNAVCSLMNLKAPQSTAVPSKPA